MELKNKKLEFAQNLTVNTKLKSSSSRSQISVSRLEYAGHLEKIPKVPKIGRFDHIYFSEFKTPAGKTLESVKLIGSGSVIADK